MLGWGKPRIFIKNLTKGGSWVEIFTPVENSAVLTPTKGEKKEAKIEGGDNEDSRYNYSKYEFAYNLRVAEGRAMPIAHIDGVVTDKYAIAIQPEDPKSPAGILMEKTTVSIDTNFNAADGSIWNHTHEALVPENGGKKVKLGVVKVEDTNGVKNVTVTEVSTDEA